MNIWDKENLIKVLQGEGVAVMPTDTLYGIVGKAESEFVVSRIYTLRKRNPEKPCIILIGNMSDLEKFSVLLSEEQKLTVNEYWNNSPRPTSIVFDCPDESLAYLHRGTHTLAFRLPADKSLRQLLLRTDPLIAPSANIEGLSPAKTIEEAKEYFGISVDMYVDGGILDGRASKVIKLHKDGSVGILRE